MSDTPFLSVVIPAYNEEKRIPEMLRYCTAYLDKQKYSYEIIVVDDGSQDKTAEAVKEINLPHVHVLASSINRGKGYAVHRGMLSAKGDYVLMCDADNATPFEHVADLLKQKDQFDVVIGSRYLPESIIHLKQPLVRIIGSRIFNLIVQILLLPGFSDTQCGFKLFTHSAAQKIFDRQTIWRWGFDIETLVLAKKFGYKIKQVPVGWYDRAGSNIHSAWDFIISVYEVFKIKWLFLTVHRDIK